MDAPVILYGSPVLRRLSAEVTERDDLQDLGSSLFATLKKAGGLGLAAPQINLLKRVFVIDTSPISEEDASIEKSEGIFINPVILEKSKENIIYREGCLSFPDIFEEVKRPEKIIVRYEDMSFKIYEEKLDGIVARIFQHELDHLDGILFIDKINALRRKLLAGKLKRIRKLSKIQ